MERRPIGYVPWREAEEVEVDPPYRRRLLILWRGVVTRLIRAARVERIWNAQACAVCGWRRFVVKCIKVRKLQRMYAYTGHFLQAFGWTPDWRQRLSRMFPLTN